MFYSFDSPSAEFIRFRKFTKGDMLDEMVRREPMMMLSLTSNRLGLSRV